MFISDSHTSLCATNLLSSVATSIHSSLRTLGNIVTIHVFPPNNHPTEPSGVKKEFPESTT